MNKIRNARFMKLTEKDGRTVAEVEFAMEPGDEGSAAGGNSRYIAILEKTGNQEFALTKVMRNQAQYELDWYENSEHQAYVEMTDAFAALDERNKLVQELLKSGDVSKDMEGGT